MEQLWKSKEKFNEYSAQKVSIAMTFGNGRDKILCYERQYSKLEQEQMLQLLKVAKENNWTSLDLSDCGLERLPDELWDIHSLKVLYLGNWNANEENANVFREIPEEIAKLENLEALSVCNLREIKIPKAVSRLPKLVYLECFGCFKNKISNNILNRNIKAIGIDCNMVEQLAKICKMKKMEGLYLAGSRVKELPIEIGELKYLRTLHLVGSQIEIIPESLLNLKNLKNFIFYDTPLEKQLPEEMKNQTAAEIILYICKQQNQHAAYFFNESKMIIVGQGNVGKSCLLERITSDNYFEKASTEGIDVKKWTYNRNGKNYTLNIWDFGGQEIYHSTHQFFLTKRSLYIFVWDARAEEEYGRIDYWLKTIESFAEDSPIIVCINKCDRNVTRINRIDFKEYKEKYPQITCVMDISCRDNINISRLRTLIKSHASSLQITKEKWLKSWYDVRTEIEKISETKKYITYDEYVCVCQKYGINVEEAKSLSKYLHDLGVILHYQDDYFLKSIVILSPEWATSAVYKILDSQEKVLHGRNGVLHLSDLPFIWTEMKLYPEDKYIFLLKIMEKFQLCFELNKESYLVAELLENTSIDCPKGWDFNNNSCIGLVYRYDFMPAGVMTRFIVNIHDYIANIDGKDMCWKKGVYLKNKGAYARVVLKDTISEKKIEVKVATQGSSSQQRELLFIIRKTLDEINRNFKKIHVEEFVPCNCSANCKFQFPYDRLCTALDKKVETIQCYESFKQVSILKLLEGIEIMRPEEASPYAISIQNNPIISNNVSVETSSTLANVVNIREVRNLIMDIQGDIAEIKDDIGEEISTETQREIVEKLEKINQDLEKINTMNTPEEIVKSGKLNKLKRWLMDFGNADSDMRKTLLGAQNIVTMVGGVAAKFNELAEKLGISVLPPI